MHSTSGGMLWRTSTLLKRISEEKVAKVASSSTLGNTTSLRYARR